MNIKTLTLHGRIVAVDTSSACESDKKKDHMRYAKSTIIALCTLLIPACNNERPERPMPSSPKPAATTHKPDDERATPKPEETPVKPTEERLSLPGPGKLKSLMRSLAILDVIICEEPEYRIYSFHPKWDDDAVMAKVDNTSGDDMFIFFKQDSAIIKGFDHESPISPYNAEEFKVWPGIYDNTPPYLLKLLDDEAVERKLVTFCIWNTAGSWESGNVKFPKGEDGGESWLLQNIVKTPEEYVAWVKDYHERETDLAPVKAIYNGDEVTAELIRAIDPSRDVTKVLDEISSITGF